MIYELPSRPPTISDTTTIYNKKQSDLLLESYKNKALFNTNMDTCFYNRKEYDDILINPENDLEKRWKTRILFEYTPRGNIIMYYNPFKSGFVYFCDNSSLPYTLLNAVVMKYTVLFKCLDLFMDENVTPEPCPLIAIVKAYEKEKDKKPEDAEKTALPKSKAFAKFKNYSQSSIATEKDPTPTGPKMINSIVHMGKIANFSFIQKSVIKDKGFRSNLLEGLDGQSKIKSWRDFKYKKSEEPIPTAEMPELEEIVEMPELEEIVEIPELEEISDDMDDTILIKYAVETAIENAIETIVNMSE